MYKNLIDKIVEERIEQNNQRKIQQANQRRIENAKFSTSSLLVGYVSKVVDNGNNRLMKMVSSSPKMFVRIKNDMLQDIETGINYPLILTSQYPMLDTRCVMEADVEPFVSTCIDAFNEKGIDYGTELTKNQAKEMLSRQARLNELIY